jgi:hypothetical protein
MNPMLSEIRQRVARVMRSHSWLVDVGSKRIIGHPESVQESFPQLPCGAHFFPASSTCDHTLIASTSKVKR